MDYDRINGMFFFFFLVTHILNDNLFIKYSKPLDVDSKLNINFHSF